MRKSMNLICKGLNELSGEIMEGRYTIRHKADFGSNANPVYLSANGSATNNYIIFSISCRKTNVVSLLIVISIFRNLINIS